MKELGRFKIQFNKEKGMLFAWYKDGIFESQIYSSFMDLKEYCAEDFFDNWLEWADPAEKAFLEKEYNTAAVYVNRHYAEYLRRV